MRRLLRDIAEGKALGDTTTLADPAVVARLKTSTRRRKGERLVALSAAALLSQMALLFTSQPMIGRMVLPLAGGTPSSVDDLPAVLPGGAAGRLPLRASDDALAAAAGADGRARDRAAAAIRGAADRRRRVVGHPDPAQPIPWLLARLTRSAGLPFVVLAANAPLVQRWFAATGHRSASDPYFLYAASNIGSLSGLLAYPVLIEPRLTLAGQGAFWGWGYGALTLLTWSVMAAAARHPRVGHVRPMRSTPIRPRAGRRSGGSCSRSCRRR